ncbi:PQQ-binding-like beta-propeller repeat protein [Saccharomonospora sp. NPDC006951]
MGAGLVVVLAGGLLVWRPWAAPDPCAEALTPVEHGGSGVPVADVAEPGALTVLEAPQAPFGPVRAVIPETRSAQPLLGGIVVDEAGNGDADIVATDAATGKQLWAFEQSGISYGSAKVGGELVMLQRPEDSQATAVRVDLKSGEVRGCTVLGHSEGESERERATAGTTVTVADNQVALLRWADDKATLNVIDPALGEPLLTSRVDLPPSFEYGKAAGDTIVFGVAGPDATSAWELVTDPRGGRTPESLRLYAFSAKNGEPLWDYGHEDFAQQLVATTATEIVVRSTRHDEKRDVFENRVAVLDAATGEENWSAELPDSSPVYYEQAVLHGDVLITSDSDPERGTHAFLTGRDLASGEQLWQIENKIIALHQSAAVGDLALIPGYERRGIEVVDIRTGESRTAFDGVSVSQVSADDTVIGLRALLDGEPSLVAYDRA